MSRDFSGADANHLGIVDRSILDITGLPITVSAWIRPDVAAAQNGIATKWGTSGQRAYSLEVSSTGTAAFLTSDGTNNSQALGATALSTAGVWQHVCGRQNTTDLFVYLNGVQDGTNATQRTLPNSNASFFIGRYTANGFGFNGMIAEVALWDAALSPEEIMALSRGMCPLYFRPDNLRAYWPLHGTGSPEPDRTRGQSHIPVAGTVPAGNIHPFIMPFVPFSAPAIPTGAITLSIDSETVYLDLTVTSTTEVAEFTDSATVYFDLQASGADVYESGYVDAATVPFDLEASGTEFREVLEAATVYFDLEASGTDIYSQVAYEDSATIYLDLRVRGVEEGTFWESFENLDAWDFDPIQPTSQNHFYITKRHATEGATSLRVTTDSMYPAEGFAAQWLDPDNGDDPNIKYWLSHAFMVEDWARLWRDGAQPYPQQLPMDFAQSVDYEPVAAAPYIRATSETTGEIGFFTGTTTVWTAINAQQWYKVQIGFQNDGTDIVYEYWFEGVLEEVSDAVWLGAADPANIPKGLCMAQNNGNVSGLVYIDDVIYSVDVQPRQPSATESAPGTTDSQWVKIREKPSGLTAYVELWLNASQTPGLDTVTEAWLYAEVYIPQTLLDTLSNNEFTNSFLETDQLRLYIVKRSGVFKWTTGGHVGAPEFGVVTGDTWYRIAWHEIAGFDTFDIYIDDTLYTGEHQFAPTGINFVGAYTPHHLPPLEDAFIGIDNLAYSTTDWVRSDNYDHLWNFEGMDPLNDAIANWPGPPPYDAGLGPGSYVASLEEGGVGPGPGLPDPVTTEEEVVYLTLTPSGVDISSATVDAETVYLDLWQPGADLSDSYSTGDIQTVYLTLLPVGGECFSSFSAEFLGEGEANLEWNGTDTLEWSSTDNLQWSAGTVSTEAHC